MGSRKRLGAAASACVAMAIFAGPAAALPIGIPTANPNSGTPPNRIVNGYQLVRTAVGSDPLENPSGPITTFGRLSDDTATEPDGNTYLVLPGGVGGPTPGYDYGHHFVFQGHENGDDLAYITRVNLDVSHPAHRITLLTPTGADGLTHFSALDGTTWDPFTRTLLFTQENGPSGGVVELKPDGSALHTLDGVFGKGSYEGIRVDDHGNLIIDEDEGGTTLHTDPSDPSSPTGPRQPNSFVYRFVPNDRSDLSAGGVLQALQVTVNGTPVIFHANDPVGDTFTSQGQLKINTPGTSWPVRWVTLHNTATDGFSPFDANAAAKAAGATPFKRPENGGFQPGSDFRSYVFDATGDTDADVALAPAVVARGGWGALYKLHFNTSGRGGRISIAVLGNSVHSSFDTLAFASNNTFLTGEDRGNTLHEQLNALDSVWRYRLGDPNGQRFIAVGRDPISLSEGEDNEPTGVEIGNGNDKPAGMKGTLASLTRARSFITQQHGQNTLWEIVRTFARQPG